MSSINTKVLVIDILGVQGSAGEQTPLSRVMGTRQTCLMRVKWQYALSCTVGSSDDPPWCSCQAQNKPDRPQPGPPSPQVDPHPGVSVLVVRADDDGDTACEMHAGRLRLARPRSRALFSGESRAQDTTAASHHRVAGGGLLSLLVPLDPIRARSPQGAVPPWLSLRASPAAPSSVASAPD